MEIMEVKSKRILIHPDIFYTGHSGAIAARQAARILTGMGYEVGVYTHESEVRSIASYSYYQRPVYTGKANYFSKAYRNSFSKTLNDFKPSAVFFIGAIVNTPLIYIDLCKQHRVLSVFMFLTQDFYCARFHAGLKNDSCTKCLTGSNLNALIHHCTEKQNRPFLYFVNYQILQWMFKARLKKIDFFLGSTYEQLGFYKTMGVEEQKTIKIPLFFDQNRVKTLATPPERYFVVIGQNRHEKGMHLIPNLLAHLDKSIQIKVLFFNQAEADEFTTMFPQVKPFIAKGQLILLPGSTMTTNAVEIISRSSGVVNLSIWATTTEFVFLETLGIGKPLIAFDLGIHNEAIKPHTNGLLIPPGNLEMMASELHQLVNDRNLYNKICSGAIKLYHQLTDDASFTSQLKFIFN